MRRLVFASLVLAFAGCEIGEIEHTGTITFIEDSTSAEGGFWGIVSLEGERFVPENLPVEFHREGMEVEFEGFVVDEDRVEGEWGIPVRLNEVEVQLDRRDD